MKAGKAPFVARKWIQYSKVVPGADAGKLFSYLEKSITVFFASFWYYLQVVKENVIEMSLNPWQGNTALGFERSTSAFE